MTSIDDGIAELLANPLEQVVHRQVVDRLLDESPDPRRALLDIILANKASDGPRLAFACWCEVTGQPERAEFIRVQCEIARGVRCKKPRYEEIRREHLGNMPARAIYRPCGGCKPCTEYHKLIRREQPLLQSLLGRAERYWMGPHAFWGQVRPTWKRGFIGDISVSAEQFLSHADIILAEHPVETVNLRSMPYIRYQRKTWREENRHLTFLRIESRCEKLVAQDEQCLSKEQLVTSKLGAAELTERTWDELESQAAPAQLLLRWFPGVKFTLPAPDYEEYE